MTVVIDCVTSPPVDAMRAAGVTGLCRYLSWADSRDTLHKVIHQAEYDALRAAGFDIVLNWEYSAKDWLGGATAGAAHSAEAVRQARALGYPAGAAIPGSADFNMTLTDWNAAGKAYAQAYSAGIRAGGYVAGVYGPWDVLEWCKSTGWFGMFWQAGMSTSWSGGRNAQPWPGAHLRQRYQTFIGGVDCDVNDVLQVNYGQYGVDAASTTTEDLMFLAIDDAGAIYLCDGMRSRWITSPQAVADIQLLGREGNIDLANNGQVRTGWSPGVFGPVDQPIQVTLTDEQIQAIIAKLPAAPSAADIAKAVNDDAAARLAG